MNTDDLRADVPALDDCVYLNTGASGPSPRRVVEAVEDVLEHHEYVSPSDDMYDAAYGYIEDARSSVARLLGADADEVALSQSTTDGINIVAGCFDWNDDVVVTTQLEHSSGRLPWERLSDLHGVEVRTVGGDGGRLDFDELKDAVEGATLVCLSSITWNYGTRLRVSEAVDVAHDAGARVLVDAAQSPGQTALDVNDWGADFVAGTGHKWLLGPWGAGFLYVDDGVSETLESPRIGYRGVEDANADGYTYRSGARRLELSTVSPASYAGLDEAVRTFLDVGLGAVESRIDELTGRLKDAVGDSLLGPRDYESGLVSFEVDDPDAFVERVSHGGIKIRSLPYPRCVRASVHAFNTAEDIDALASYL